MPLVDHKPRVLIVDDEPALRELLADALETSRYDLILASSGREAITLAADRSPDLIVTDLCLNDCTGLDVIDRLRKTQPNIPAVLITGRANAAERSRASRRGMEVFDKPLNLDRLEILIKRALRSREAEKENQELRQQVEQRYGLENLIGRRAGVVLWTADTHPLVTPLAFPETWAPRAGL